ncbi:MAG: (Fe-S)-binding protein, partial [Syntrophobacterales bacterium CG_4_9_14_3_um_filter_49_8]
MAEPAKRIVVDPGLDETIKKLTLERIESTINKVLTKEAAARLKVYLQTCVHCGLCAEACHFYLSHDKDPRFSPVG